MSEERAQLTLVHAAADDGHVRGGAHVIEARGQGDGCVEGGGTREVTQSS